MSWRATEGTALLALVRDAIGLLKQVSPRPSARPPGRPVVYPDWLLAAMILVGLLKKKKAKSAQWEYWRQHQRLFQTLFANESFPGKSCYSDRYRKAHRVLQKVIVHVGRDAVKRKWADARCVAADKSLVRARGNPKHRQRSSKGVDLQAGWAKSPHHGWVWGYGVHMIATAPKPGEVVWPLAASLEPGHHSESAVLRGSIDRFPSEVRYGLFDAGFDSNALAEQFEDSAPARSRRRFLCPEIPRPNVGKPRKNKHSCSRERRYHAQRRQERRCFRTSPWGKKLYRRRKVTIEPLHERIKTLFDLHHRVWHFGLDNNRTQALASIFAYQLLLRHNHKKGNRTACVASITHGL